MNCDAAFDYLTDPQRCGAAELKRHLESCSRCRQMQATLEPALSLFEDSTFEESTGSCSERSIDVSSDWSSDFAPHENRPVRVNPADVAFAQESAARLSHRSRVGERWQRTGRFITRYAAVFLAGALVASAALSLPLKAQPCTWKAPDHVAPSVVTPKSVVMACVKCHRSGNADRMPAGAASVVLGCVACHQDDHASPDSRSETLPIIQVSDPAAPHGTIRTLECLWPQSSS